MFHSVPAQSVDDRSAGVQANNSVSGRTASKVNVETFEFDRLVAALASTGPAVRLSNFWRYFSNIALS